MALHDLPRRARSAFTLSAPSWATPWRARAAEAPRTGPSVAVLGNCQARGVAQALRLLAPDARVTYFSMGTLKRDHGDIEGLVRTVAGFDHVFSQAFPGGLLPGGDIGTLHAREGRLKQFPTIVFSAFHPDMVYAGRTQSLADQKLAPSPLGQYHSAIALCAYRLGLDVAQTASLFREDVFQRLGYLDHWDPAVRELIANAASMNFGLEREVARWSRRGAFMHVVNHPKAFVIGDIARRLLVESGFNPEPVEMEDYLGDELVRDVVWPVYPAIADLFGLTGSYLFKTKPQGEAFPQLYDLRGFLAKSFAIYDTLKPEALACPRVDTWVEAPWITEVFLAAKTR
ncbi:WcbI family polysaccharide biosynthesis putative acetyltransferase [Methylobacterium symbioticum]|uniref:WcbI family polysaccharide biosynthesis putative acetyltransferase n=1 Tax=Methylobacterium symbioticum TaxID=2584084 RepID=UPI0011585138|nr:WcbI family polysaccharide biosynthesis putative acetyltransferase [Methylobacterium symbioticum]